MHSTLSHNDVIWSNEESEDHMTEIISKHRPPMIIWKNYWKRGLMLAEYEREL